MVAEFSLSDLAKIIDSRAEATAKTSYTKSLLEAGLSHAAKKFGEESFELVIASVDKNRSAVITEAADVLYHLLVVLKASNVTIIDVMLELQRRTGQSGLQEKASRSKS
jgi:phosphoribosyl-ATP pyrophosphohydrolase